MKQLLTFLFLAVSAIIIAQAPQGIPYQAIVRNTDGTAMASTSLTMTFKIHDISATGTVVYEETHSTSSNTQGLVSLNVGAGTPVTGTFASINWGSGAKFLHVLMNSGSGNIDLGTQQMMSVPYSLFSEGSNSTSLSVSATGDTLLQGNGDFIIIPGLSVANNTTDVKGGLGSQLISPFISECANQYISVTGCNGVDSIFYNDVYYNIVEIAGQCWFAENLTTTKFNDGQNITYVSDASAWSTANYPAFCWYNNEIASSTLYGGIYNWYTVSTSKLCPIGWHVPSDCDWMYLEKFLDIPVIELNSYYRQNDGSTYALRSGSWNDGSFMNLLNFSAIPSPSRSTYGSFSIPLYLNYSAAWYTSTQSSENRPIVRGYSNGIIGLRRHQYSDYKEGIAVRCIKD